MQQYGVDLRAGRLRPGPGGAVRVLAPAELGRAGAPPQSETLARLWDAGGSRVMQCPDRLLGVACQPGRADSRIAFCLDDRTLWLVADTLPPLGDLPLDTAPGGPAGVLLALLERWAEDAAPALQALERRLDALEETLERGQLRGFEAAALAERRALAALHVGWGGLTHLARDIQADPAGLLTRPQRAGWERFAERAARLRDEAEGLRATILQLWQLYHARLELRQTQVATWLTVIATVFLPLSLVTSWYGMNFPDLLAPSVPWGYPAVCCLCASLALGGLWYCHRKGML